MPSAATHRAHARRRARSRSPKRVTPSRKAGETASYTFFGSLPGTWAMVKQREDGVNLAALFNQREDASGLSYYDLEGLLDKAAERMK